MSGSADAQMLACTLSKWQGDPTRCRWCNAQLGPRRQRWCSQPCVDEYKAQHWWGIAREAALTRDHRQCQDCVYGPADNPGQLEVHHLQPVQGRRTASCLHHAANLTTLCQEHHQGRHRAAA